MASYSVSVFNIWMASVGQLSFEMASEYFNFQGYWTRLWWVGVTCPSPEWSLLSGKPCNIIYISLLSGKPSNIIYIDPCSQVNLVHHIYWSLLSGKPSTIIYIDPCSQINLVPSYILILALRLNLEPSYILILALR